jgi:hypothetical protein
MPMGDDLTDHGEQETGGRGVLSTALKTPQRFHQSRRAIADGIS